ncbi:MAG: hypothetical protein JKY45_09620 [Emcibacter sp.]|nr:hypothetical protein [Emcibacter sp.]
MTRKALLITGQESETVSTLARNLIPVGGISIFARQMKQMKAFGVTEMHVVTDWFIKDFEKEILNCTARPEKIFIHNTKDAPLKLLEHNIKGNSWLLIEEGILIDDRIIHQVTDHPSPTVINLIGHNEFLEEKTTNGILLQLDGQEGYFGSIAKLSSTTLSANIRKLNSLESLPNALKSISRAEDCNIVKVIDIPLYLSRQRRAVDLVWLPVLRREDDDKGTDMLLDQAQKNGLDWVARYIHRHVENFIVKYLCKTPITPNQVTAITSLAGLYIMYLFCSGYMLSALCAAYAVGIFYGVSDKLAAVKIQNPKFAKFTPLLEKAIEYGWYFTIATHLSTLSSPDFFAMAPYLLAAGLVLFHLADDIQCEFFRRMTGQYIYTIKSFDQKFQLVSGNRNTQMWTLLPFALFDLWYLGFGIICAYAIITFFVHQLRLVYHLKNFMVADSKTFAENFQKTKIL